MRATLTGALVSTLATLFDAGGRELRYALRGLRKTPTFTISVVGILALAIGANAAVFGLLYALLVRPLPYPGAERLFLIDAERQYAQAPKPVPARFRLIDLDEWRGRLRSTESIAMYLADPVVLVDGSGSRVISGAIVSDGFFSTVGAAMKVGRSLGPADRLRAAVVVSERLANQLVGSPGGTLGAQLRLNSRIYEVVGVAPATFALPAADVDVWLGAEYEVSVRPRAAVFGVLARTRTHADGPRVQVDVDQAVAAAAPGNPAIFGDALRATAVPLREQVVGGVRPTLMTLGLAAGLILVVACTNVAGLLVARNAALARERRIQAALGASNLRLLVRGLMDAIALATGGAIAGRLAAAGLMALVGWLEPSGIPPLATIGVGGPMWSFAGAVCALTTLSLTLVPALPWCRRSAVATSTERSATGGARRLGRLLSVAEFAMATVLMIGAILLSRSLLELLRTDIGATTEHVTVVSLRPAQLQPRRDAESISFVERATARLRELPGVLAVGAGSSVPPHSQGLTLTLKRQGDTVDYAATGVVASPGYFEALQIRLVKGRFFGLQDADGGPPVIVLSEPTARRLFGTDDALGRTVAMPTLRDGTKGSADMAVVGVIAPVKYSGIAAEADEQVYRPFAQQPWPALSLVIRTDRDLPGLAGQVRSALSELDPALAVVSLGTLDEAVNEEAAAPRLRSALVSGVALAGVALAASGLFGVIAYSVSQRTTEIAIRLVCGATPRDIQRLILGEGVLVAALGVLLGLVGALALTRWLATVVYRVDPRDPTSFAVAAGVLLLVAVAATYVPARRATQGEPLSALKAN